MTPTLRCLLLACLFAGAAAGALDFRLRVADGLLDEPYTGRVYVQVMPASGAGPREPRLADRWVDPPWLFTRDVEDWAGGPLVLADLPAEQCFPDVPGAMPDGAYRAQAFLRLDRFSPDPGRGAADLVSGVTGFDHEGRSDRVLELNLDHRPTVEAPEETERVKWVEQRSEALSAFHGFDYPMQAGVVLPVRWDPARAADYPVLVYIGGFTDDHLSGVGHMTRHWRMFHDAVVVVPNARNYRGHSVFVDSDSIGPWGTALMTELLPAIDRRFGLAGAARRYVTGISSGGWSSLWLQLRWPEEFQHAWAFVPDPVDFRDFQGIDLYREGDNFFVTRDGEPRPLARPPLEIRYQDFVRHEDLLGPGMQIHSFEATFSPRGADGAPRPLFDRDSGAIDPEVAEAFRRFDISHQLRERWDELGPRIAGKLTVVAGGQDTFYLDGAVRRLQETVAELEAELEVRVIESMGHQPHRPTLFAMSRVMADGSAPVVPVADDSPRGLHERPAQGMGGGVDRWLLIIATLLAAAAGVAGMLSVRHGRRSRWTLVLMGAAFVAQLGFLWLRGEARAACPLIGLGEILAFLAWSLTLFYLAVGPAYRISLLGVFSAPVVVLFQAVALIPGVLERDPARKPVTDGWGETHAAMSVLGYGALALAAVAGVMFLVLDRQLKEQHLNSGLFRHLPPVRELLVSLQRLMWLGMAMLTVGVVAGLLMEREGGTGHLVAAVGVWLAYAVLIAVKAVRGMTGRRFSLAAVVLFLLSLSVFAFV